MATQPVSKIRIYSRSLLLGVLILPFLSISYTGYAQYQSLCWRISGNGLKHPSYLYGTMHVSDKRVFNFGDKANRAFDDSKAYAMEVDPEKMMALSAVSKMIMTGGMRISKLIPDSDYHFLDSIVHASTGGSMVIYNALEPILVSAILDEYTIGINKSDSNTMSQFMDLYLQTKAKDEKKKVIGIETIDEQIDALHSLNYQEQAELLIQSIDEVRSGAAGSDKDLLKYYIDQNLDSILANSDEHQMPPKFYKALVTDRNVRMADRISVFIHKQPTFVAVGALHLPGPEGVIALLRAKGYTVEEWR
jgi:uncharacterized protein YbaP (TraB family)